MEGGGGGEGAMVDGRGSTGAAPTDDARLNPAPRPPPGPRPVSNRSKYLGVPDFSSGLLDYKPLPATGR